MTTRILVVDDEPHIVQVVSLKLRNAGYEVLTAADGEEALELAMTPGSRPALVITDLQMPLVNGLELCKALKLHAPTATIPVVMLTARGYTLDDSDLAIGNIRKVLSKPFSPRAVLQLVEQLLGEVSRGGTELDDPTIEQQGCPRELACSPIHRAAGRRGASEAA